MDIQIELTATGGTDGLRVAPCAPGDPGPGQIRVRHDGIGVNFIDIYQRTGLYRLPLPAVLGVEGAGVVEAVGPDADGLTIGDRIVYAGLTGGYAASRLLPAWRAVPLPDAIDSDIAAASFLRGLTAHMLLTRTHTVGAGSTILVHAAAGGLGATLTAWAKQRGATVIGTAGTPQKAQTAREAGIDHVIIGRDADIVAEVRALTDGRGVDFAIDGIGGTMLARTLGCVRRFGTVASIGQAAGPIPPLDVEDLGPLRSLTLARPSVMAYAADPDTYRAAALDVIRAMEGGIAPTIGRRYGLADAARAQADLEAGATTGSLLLVP